MSARASAYAKGLLECPNGELISAREKLVLMVLADSHQDRAGRYTYPSIQTIAKDAMCDRRSCQRYLAALERKEVILRMHPANQGRAQITYYFFTELDEVPKGWQPAALSDDGFFLQKGGRRAVERAAKGRQNASALNGTRVREPEPKQEQQKQLPLIPLAGEGEANGGTSEIAERCSETKPVGRQVGLLSAAEKTNAAVEGNGAGVATEPRGGGGTPSATSAADLAQVADAGSAAEHAAVVADVSVDGRHFRPTPDGSSGSLGFRQVGVSAKRETCNQTPQAIGADEAEGGRAVRDAAGRCGLGQVDDAVVASEFTPDQLEHLRKCNPQTRADFESYYREENAKAAAAAKRERKPEEPELEFAEVAAARAWVMRKLGFIERRRGGMGPVVEAALRVRAEQGESLGVLAQCMVGAVRKHAKLASRMRYQYGPAKFISLGLWLDENTWPWDYKEIARQQARAF